MLVGGETESREAARKRLRSGVGVIWKVESGKGEEEREGVGGG